MKHYWIYTKWNKKNIKPLAVYNYKTNELIGVFDKPNSCIEYLKTELNIYICGCSIYRVLKGEYKQTKGFIFKRITKKEYYNYKNKLNRKEWCFIWQIWISRPKKYCHPQILDVSLCLESV